MYRVTRDTFPNVTSVSISGGTGNDSLNGPDLPATIHGDDGSEFLQGYPGSTVAGDEGTDSYNSSSAPLALRRF
jgi:hypothetical protein